MSDERQLENLVHQKLEAFRMEPEAADWDAIYNRLHGRKRRRFLWLILPVMLVAGATYFYDRVEGSGYRVEGSALRVQGSGLRVADTALSVQGSGLRAEDKGSKMEDEALSVQGSGLRAEDKGSSVEDPAAKRNIVSTTTAADHEDPEGARSPGKDIISRGNKTTATKNDLKNGLNDPIDIPKHTATTQIADNSVDPATAAAAAATTTLEDLKTSREESTDARQWNMASISTNSSLPALVTPDQLHTTGRPPSPQQQNASTPGLKEPDTKSPPKKTWHMGAYLAAGIHMPRTTSGGQRSLDAIPNMPVGSGTQIITNSVYNSGMHWAGGFSLQKEMKRLTFFTGLGLQWNRWSADQTMIEQRSTSTGVLRNFIGSSSITYRQTGIEIPMLLGISLMRSRSSSLHLLAGLNNMFIGTLKSEPSTEMWLVRYQPQLRTGLLYQHKSKGSQRLQVGPYFQYGLGYYTKQTQDLRFSQGGLQVLYLLK